MKRSDWRDNTPRAEQNYYSDILRILEEFFLGDNGLLTTQTITKSEALEMYARQAAERMVVGRLQANARTWRQAARSSMRSGEIFTSLRRELAGPVGDRARELVLRNSRLITTFPHEVAALVAARAAAHYAGGGRSLTLAQSDKLLSRATRVRARLIARTEVSKASTALTQARAEDLGLVWYVWQTSEDSRVRFSHRRMDRVLCRWSDPPNPESLAHQGRSAGHYDPGNIFNCRCFPAPLLRLDQVQWPSRVYMDGAVRPMTLAAFRKLNRLSRHEERLGTQEFAA